MIKIRGICCEVLKFDKDTDEFLGKYSSKSKAAELNNISNMQMYNLIKNKKSIYLNDRNVVFVEGYNTRPSNSKAIYKINKKNNKLEMIYKSSAQASEMLGLSQQAISKICNGKLKQRKNFILTFDIGGYENVE